MNEISGPPCKLAQLKPTIGWWVMKTGFDGAFQITSYQLAMAYKPNWIARFAMKRTFNIEWRDNHE